MDKFSKKAKNILEGFTNEVTGKNQELSDQRMEICQSCVKFHKNFCLRGRGGCGCFLPAKTTVEDEKCPVDKW